MTISYAGEVPNGSSFGCFWRILCNMAGVTSISNIILHDKFIISVCHDRATTKYFGAQSESIPMSFVLGFYVSLVVKRWWEQYKLLPWPDTLALFISAGIPGAVSKDETGRLMRRNIVRYAILAYVITLQRVSLRVKRRFPTWQHG
ncbi:unnamed protein product [Leptidea sinapis]|uniref:Bestrophin homolog n=1 Tax=Leptidea sinapis TaxID=189913 RepID=A0A5E4QAQ8_9NEOP|nr:unnamed protein product [Leptidea sinapis]